MYKIVKAILILFLAFIISASYIFVDSTMLSPIDFKVTYLDISDGSIPEKFDGFSIMYFSDLQYGEIFNEERLTSLKESLNYLSTDLIVFGGDIVDASYSPTSNDVVILENFFNSLDAKYGMFALLGDYDTSSDTKALLAQKIFRDTGFEILSGLRRIYIDPSCYINIAGYSYNEEVEYENQDPYYTIAFCHDYHAYQQLPSFLPLVVCGDAHARQTDIRSNIKLGRSDNLYQCASVGMSNQNYRLFNDPEILIIRFITA